jgi:drug/metabolite transporter (DMT)-like permease
VGITYFKERPSKTKFAVVILSFLGALIVMFPTLLSFEKGSYLPDFFVLDGTQITNWYYLFVFAAIICWSINCTVVKCLGKTESSKAQTFYVMLFSSIFSYPVAFLKWGAINVSGVNLFLPYEVIPMLNIHFDVKMLFMTGVLAACYFIHSLAFFHAFKNGELSTVMPFDYTRIVFAGILGYYLFGEAPEMNAYIGYLLIVVPGIYLIRNEVRKRSRMKKQLEQEVNELEAEFDNV